MEGEGDVNRAVMMSIMEIGCPSCKCGQCTFAKHKAGGKKLVKHDERAFRHGAKRALAKDHETADILPATYGCRIG